MPSRGQTLILPTSSCHSSTRRSRDPVSSFFTLTVLLVRNGYFLMVVDCVARVPKDAAKKGLSLSWFGSVILLENVRFHVEEEEKGVDKDENKIKADAEASKDFRSSSALVGDVVRSLHTVRTAR